jgi:hypothetical protein
METESEADLRKKYSEALTRGESNDPTTAVTKVCEAISFDYCGATFPVRATMKGSTPSSRR